MLVGRRAGQGAVFSAWTLRLGTLLSLVMPPEGKVGAMASAQAARGKAFPPTSPRAVQYKAAYVYFSGRVSKQQLEAIKECPHLVARLKALKEVRRQRRRWWRGCLPSSSPAHASDFAFLLLHSRPIIDARRVRCSSGAGRASPALRTLRCAR